MKYIEETEKEIEIENQEVEVTEEVPEITEGSLDETEIKPQEEKRKKRKKKRYFLKILITLAVLVGLYFFATSSVFGIDKFKVEGNSHYTPEQIVEMTGIKEGDNLFKAKTSAAKKELLSDPYIKVVDINRKLPNGIDIIIEERIEGAIVMSEEVYFIIDSEGMILNKTEEIPLLTLIEGITPVKPEEGTVLKAKEADQLKKSLDFIRFMEENDFFVQKIDVSGVGIKMYVLNALICEGSFKDIKNGIEPLRLVITDLLGKGIERGTISISNDGTCSFRPDI